MHDLRVLPSEAEPILRSMTAIATLGGHRVPLPVERDLILAAQRYLLPAPIDVDRLTLITPAELRELLPGEDERLRAVRFMALVPYVSLEIDAAKRAAVDAFAIQLAVDPAQLRALHRRREAETRQIALDALRRGWPLPLTARTSALLRGIVEARRRQPPDEALAERYCALRLLPQGTLGRALYELHHVHGWLLPGEVGGLDETLVPSDLRCVLAGLDPGLASRPLAVGFAAGLSQVPLGYEVVLEAIFALYAAARLAAAGERTEGTPQIDLAALADAHARGLAARIEPALNGDWWRLAAEDVAALRARYGIEPVPLAAREPARSAAERRSRAA